MSNKGQAPYHYYQNVGHLPPQHCTPLPHSHYALPQWLPSAPSFYPPPQQYLPPSAGPPPPYSSSQDPQPWTSTPTPDQHQRAFAPVRYRPDPPHPSALQAAKKIATEDTDEEIVARKSKNRKAGPKRSKKQQLATKDSPLDEADTRARPKQQQQQPQYRPGQQPAGVAKEAADVAGKRNARKAHPRRKWQQQQVTEPTPLDTAHARAHTKKQQRPADVPAQQSAGVARETADEGQKRTTRKVHPGPNQKQQLTIENCLPKEANPEVNSKHPQLLSDSGQQPTGAVRAAADVLEKRKILKAYSRRKQQQITIEGTPPQEVTPEIDSEQQQLAIEPAHQSADAASTSEVLTYDEWRARTVQYVVSLPDAEIDEFVNDILHAFADKLGLGMS